MMQMGKPPLSSFRGLGSSQQVKFNRLLNDYIRDHLQDENWKTKLLSDFNRIVNEDILNEEFDPSKEYVPIVNTEYQLLLTEEQQNNN